MQKYFGLRGKALRAALIWAVVMPSYILYGSCALSISQLYLRIESG